jgi:23S rRNA U2552 (ribose-2'-O)-methylase RlmE/FtsJ
VPITILWSDIDESGLFIFVVTTLSLLFVFYLRHSVKSYKALFFLCLFVLFSATALLSPFFCGIGPPLVLLFAAWETRGRNARLLFGFSGTRVRNFETARPVGDLRASGGELRQIMCGRNFSDRRKGDNLSEWQFVTFFQVSEMKDATLPSRAYFKLDEVVKLHPGLVHGKVVDFGCGLGGWTQRSAESDLVNEVQSITKLEVQAGPTSQEHRTPKWDVRAPWYVKLTKFIQGDFYTRDRWRLDRTFDTILCDAGDRLGGDLGRGLSKSQLRDEENINWKVFDFATREILSSKSDFVVKVLVPWDSRVHARIKEVQVALGRGTLVRLPQSRNLNPEMYFVSGEPTDPEADVAKFVTYQKNRIRMAIQYFREYDNLVPGVATRGPKVGQENFWAPIKERPPVDRLERPVVEQQSAIEQVLQYASPGPDPVRFQAAEGSTRFYEELGWFYAPPVGTKANYPNTFVDRILGKMSEWMPEMSFYRMTDTTPEGQEEMLMRKLDNAPVENHQHYNLLFQGYRAVSDYLKAQGFSMDFPDTVDGIIDQEELRVRENLNRDAVLGMQDEHEGVATMGQYWDSGLWRPRVKQFLEGLRDGKYLFSIFNSIGKREKKKTMSAKPKGSRLVWFLPATGRLGESFLAGKINSALEKLPFNVSGRDVTDYGDFLRDMSGYGTTEPKGAIFEDVASWDTRIGLGMYELQHWFVQSLTKGNLAKRLIKELFRIWAWPIPMIHRARDGRIQKVLYQSRGQVASGIQLTYAMNTITNIVVIMSRIAVSEGFGNKTKEQQYSLFRQLLREGNNGRRAFVVSGDDSVVFGDRKVIGKYSDSYAFHNDLGLYRKDMMREARSVPEWDLTCVEFCSHMYAPVKYITTAGEIIKFMPFRSLEEIFGKIRLMGRKPRDMSTQEAWARVQGLNLLLKYHHIREVRLVALALLDATQDSLVLQGMSKPGLVGRMAWLGSEDPEKIISSVLFGEKSLHPKLTYYGAYASVKIHQLGYLPGSFCYRKGLQFPRDSPRGEWKRGLRGRIRSLNLGASFFWIERLSVFQSGTM